MPMNTFIMQFKNILSKSIKIPETLTVANITHDAKIAGLAAIKTANRLKGK